MNDKQANKILDEMTEMFGELPDPEVYPIQFAHKCRLFHYYKNRKVVKTDLTTTDES